MSVIFKEHMRKTVECYVDDLAVKSKNKEDHLHNLITIFDFMQKHHLKMNPTKSFMGVSSGKFLGFVVTSKGIFLDLEKVKAINEMPPPCNFKELRGYKESSPISGILFLTYLDYQPFSKLMKKGVSFVWDEACQYAFGDLKEYLTKPSVLIAPVPGQPFLIYVRGMDDTLGALLAQYNEHGHEHALYYLSRIMIGAERRYTPIEKECLALVFAVQKM